tara:strand:- start:512 stop:715 length:204 start_codon:yes stop_codon:yes gene_type:complete
VDTFCSHFQKKRREVPNQSALESTNLGATNCGPNFEIQQFGADLVSFEMTVLPQNCKLILEILSGKF